RLGRGFDVECPEIDQDGNDSGAGEAGLDQVVLVVARDGHAEPRPGRELAELRATPRHTMRGYGLPTGNVTHRREVVVVDDDRFVAGEDGVGDDGTDCHLVDDDVGAAAGFAQ